MNTAYKNIFKATTLFGGVQGLNILLNLARTKLVAVILGPAGMGLNSIYNETRELIHTSTNIGLDVSGVRDIATATEKHTQHPTAENMAILDDKVRVLRSWVLLLAAFGTLVCLLLAAPLSLFTFGDYSHVWGYALLSPAVGFSTVTCGEIAVLKGLRRLKAIAQVSLINVAAALPVSIPIYYFWGIDGVLPAILLFTGVSMLITLLYGHHAHPLSYTLQKDCLVSGRPMLHIGLVVVISEGLAHVVILAIQSYLNNTTSLHIVGLYNAGYIMTMTYAGMVFTAMETDYYPRLTGIINNIKQRNDLVTKQIEINILLVAPLLTAFIILSPWLVPLLLDSKFEEIIPMIQVTAIGLLFRAVTLPNTFLYLASGNSKIYFTVNFIGALDMLIVIPGYIYGGLWGAGLALTIQNLFDMLLVLCISRCYYKITFSKRVFYGAAISLLALTTIYYLATI